MNPRTCVRLSRLNKTNDAVGQRRIPLKLRVCLNDTDVPYFDRFSLVDKLANKYVSSFLCFSYVSGTNTMCTVVTTTVRM